MRALGWLVLAAAVGGCAGVQLSESGLSASLSAGGEMSRAELRVRVRSLARRFSGLLESLADDVARNGDVATRLAMTRFKIGAVPAIQDALFEPDPLAALLDAWALLDQLELMLDERHPAALRELAGERFDVMREELAALWTLVGGTITAEDMAARVREWALAHPIERTIAARPSSTQLFAQLTARGKLSLTGATAELLETTADLAERADLQAAWFPRNLRWQAEYLVLEGLLETGFAALAPAVGTPATGDAAPCAQPLDTPTAPRPPANVGALVDALEDASRTAARLPNTVASEREALVAAMREERQALEAFVAAERLATVEDADRLVRGWLALGVERAEGLVDRVFRWMVLLVVLVGLAVSAVAFAWRARRGGPASWAGRATRA